MLENICKDDQLKWPLVTIRSGWKEDRMDEQVESILFCKTDAKRPITSTIQPEGLTGRQIYAEIKAG